MKSESMFRPLRLANLAIGAALAVSATLAFAQAKPLAGQTVKIAWIDPLTGLMGPVGNNQLNTVRFMAEKYNASNPAGVKFEVVPFDNKLSPTESLNALKSAIDQDIRYVMQGNGSSVALALVDAVNKHNERNPGKEVVYLNYRRRRPRPDQQQVQLLALPLRRRHLDEDGGHDDLHQGHAGGEERLPAEPELLARGAGGEVRQGDAGAEASRHQDRRRRSAPDRRRCATSRPTSPRSRLRAPTR